MLILHRQQLLVVLVAGCDVQDSSMVSASVLLKGFFKKVSCLRQKKKRKTTHQENLKPPRAPTPPSCL